MDMQACPLGSLPAGINLMMEPLLCDIQFISLLFQKVMHPADRLRLLIVGTDMHTLDAQTLVIGQKLHF